MLTLLILVLAMPVAVGMVVGYLGVSALFNAPSRAPRHPFARETVEAGGGQRAAPRSRRVSWCYDCRRAVREGRELSSGCLNCRRVEAQTLLEALEADGAPEHVLAEARRARDLADSGRLRALRWRGESRVMGDPNGWHAIRHQGFTA